MVYLVTEVSRFFEKRRENPIRLDSDDGPERYAFQSAGRAPSRVSKTVFSTAVDDEETLSVREVRVRSSVKRDTDWTVNISLRWHGTRLGVSRLAREGLERWVLCIHFSIARVSRA